MSDLEREEFICRIKAMSDEEKMLACSLMPSEILADEVKHRLLVAEHKLMDAAGVILG